MSVGSGRLYHPAAVTAQSASGAHFETDVLGRITLVSDIVGAVTFSIEFQTTFGSKAWPGGSTLIDCFPGQAPGQGFVIDVASQGTENMPGGSLCFPPSITPITPVVDVGSYTLTWACNPLPIDDVNQSAYDPATMMLQYWGIWTLICSGSINAGSIGQLIANINTFYDWKTEDGLTTIPNPFTPQQPVYMFSGTYDYDTDLCSGLGSLSDVQVVDPVTGEFSWTLPPGAAGVLITLHQEGFDDIETTVLSPTTNYIPSDIYGSVEVTLAPFTGFPFCLGEESTLSLGITVPYEPFGPSGITGGIDLGGTATLQFIGNPSGIYTLVRGKRNDTLYERIPSTTTQDVKIPDPTIRTAFLGE